jgi:hypothetical protein
MRQLPGEFGNKTTKKRTRQEMNDHADTLLAFEDSLVPIKIEELAPRHRIFKSMYARLRNEPRESDPYGEHTESDREINQDIYALGDRVLFQLIDRVDSIFMFDKTVEECHLKSQSNKKFAHLADNINNVVYMSRQMHEYYDNISLRSKAPLFTLDYASHNTDAIYKNVKNSKKQTKKDRDMQAVAVYSTTVRVTFFSSYHAAALKPYFRSYVCGDKDTVIFITLLIDDPRLFAECLTHKADETRKIWAKKPKINTADNAAVQIAGIESESEDDVQIVGDKVRVEDDMYFDNDGL